jgi:hypothetical protein
VDGVEREPKQTRHLPWTQLKVYCPEQSCSRSHIWGTDLNLGTVFNNPALAMKINRSIKWFMHLFDTGGESLPLSNDLGGRNMLLR